MPKESYAERVRAVLHQSAPPSLDNTGRRVLFVCDHCGRRWLQDGGRYTLELSAAQVQALAQELAADLEQLPRATCRICAAQRGGELNIDEYLTPAGPIFSYGFSYEGSEPAGMHLLCSILNVKLGASLRGRAPRAGVVTDFQLCRAVMAWLEQLPMPAPYHPLDRPGAAAMARMNPPGHNQPGAEHFVWRGADWHTTCPALGGAVMVSMHQAIPNDEPYSLRITLECWHAIARRMRVSGRIAGEPEEGETVNHAKN